MEVIETKVVVPGASTDSPEEVIQYLRSVDLKRVDQRNGNTDEHRIQVRQVIRQFEELTARAASRFQPSNNFLLKASTRNFARTPTRSFPATGAASGFISIPFFRPACAWAC